jgi:opacity protein-like surface antigen
MKAANLLAMKAPSVLSACLLALWIGGVTPVRAQEYQAGFYFTTLVPRGGFSENITNNGYGGGGLFLVRLGDSPLLVGGDLGAVTYGSESHRESISTTIPVQVRVRTSNNILLFHSLVRLQHRNGPIRPYADGLIGLKHLFTTTSITSLSTGDEIAGDTDLSDTTLSYGFGGGAQIPLSGKGNGKFAIMLDANARYLRGGRASYLKKGSIRQVDGFPIFDVLSSRTDVVSVQIGVTFRF